MKRLSKKLYFLLTLLLLLALAMTGCGKKKSKNESQKEPQQEAQMEEAETEEDISEDTVVAPDVTEFEEQDELEVVEIDEYGTYTSKEEVSEYIYCYGHLPANYITKKEAQKQGWDSKAGNLQDVCPGMSIGGDYFGNYEGILPDVEGREYHECDIDYEGGRRNAKRIIYSNEGQIYYTEDHYKTFELLYGTE